MPKPSIFQTITGAPSRSYAQPQPVYHSIDPSQSETSSVRRRSTAFSHSSASTSSIFHRTTKADDECSNYSGSVVSVPELWDHVRRKTKRSSPPSIQSEGASSSHRKENRRQSLRAPTLPPPGPVDLGPSLTSLSNDPYAPTYLYRPQRVSSPNLLFSSSSTSSSSDRHRSLPHTPQSLSSASSPSRRSNKSTFTFQKKSQISSKSNSPSGYSIHSNDETASVSDTASFHSNTVTSPRISPSSGSPRVPPLPKLPSRVTNPSLRGYAMEVVREELNEPTTSDDCSEEEFKDATLIISPNHSGDKRIPNDSQSIDSDSESFFSALEDVTALSLNSNTTASNDESTVENDLFEGYDDHELVKDDADDHDVVYDDADDLQVGDEDDGYTHISKRESLSSQTTYSYTFASSENSYLSRVPSTVLTTPSPSEFDLKITNYNSDNIYNPLDRLSHPVSKYSRTQASSDQITNATHVPQHVIVKRKDRSSNTPTPSITTTHTNTTTKSRSTKASKGPAIEIIQSSANNGSKSITQSKHSKPSTSKRLPKTTAADADPKWHKEVTWLGDHPPPKSITPKKTRQRANSQKETSQQSSVQNPQRNNTNRSSSSNNISTLPVLTIPSAPPSVLSCPSEKSVTSVSSRKALSNSKTQPPQLPAPSSHIESTLSIDHLQQKFDAAGSISAVSHTDEPFKWPKKAYLRNSNISLPKENDSMSKSMIKDNTPSPPPLTSSNRRLRKTSTTSLPDISTARKSQSSRVRGEIMMSARSSMIDTYQDQVQTHSILSIPVGESYRSLSEVHKTKYVNTFTSDGKSSMVALTISANAAAHLTREKGLFGRKRKTSLDNLPNHLKMNNFSSAALQTSSVSFNHTAPLPPKVKDNDVVVQVYASAVDAWDRANVDTQVKNEDGYGSIPGRSFCGKVVETGCNVTKVSRGDFVYGLQELEKSGALAEYMSVNRGLLSLAPNGSLTVEQIAALPCAGIVALQAMEMLCADLPSGSKVLILNAHEGAGVIAMQLSQLLRPSRDLWVTAHCPPGVPDGDVCCEVNGATEVIQNDVLTTLHSLYESSYDAVIDTIGGRRIYDGSRRILHHSGMFVTLVGDEVGIVDRTSQWRNGIRSIRRAFFPKDSKSLTYWCPIYDEREDVRDALEKLCALADNKGLKPLVRKIYAFEDGGRAFAEEEDQNGVVVRVR